MKRGTVQPLHNALVSYHYTKTGDLDRLAGLRVIGDSGAFSAKTQGAVITVDDLYAWQDQWRHRLYWGAALDVIGNPEATYRNWLVGVDRYDMPVVPTIHFGTNPREIDRYVARGCDFIGLGGLVGVSRKPAMRWLVQVLRYARATHPQVRFHGWGCTSNHHALLPFYSVDSSSWGSAFRYGNVMLVDPRTGAKTPYSTNGSDVYRQDISSLLADYYNMPPSKVAQSTPDTKRDVIRVASMAVAAQNMHLQRKHGSISAPEWIRNGVPGPLIHAADGSLDHIAAIAEIAREYDKEAADARLA